MDRHIPLVFGRGEPYVRGEHLGRTQAARVAQSVAVYTAMIRTRTGMRRPEILGAAERYVPAIAAFAPHLLEEMRGIAAGSGRDLLEIVAINARTELLYGAAARPECTAVGVTKSASTDGHIRLAQNWDWHASIAGATILWAIQREDGPDLLTYVEAGVVGKIGVNAAGLALCINLLASESDHPGPSAPMHVILRRILEEARSVDDAIALLAATPRCTSCNHLLADSSGALADVEATPSGQAVLRTVDGVLTHTNHCTAPDLFARDRFARESPETLARGERAQTLAGAMPLDAAALRAILADHANPTGAICQHPQDDQQHTEEQTESISSLIFDLTAGTLDLADGPPCTYSYRTLQLDELLRIPSPAQ